MIHIVDNQADTILDYITLDNIIDDNHKKSLEENIETYDSIVLGGLDYDEYLAKRNRIIISDDDGTLREFVLYEVDKYRDTEGRKTHFYSHASFLELKKSKVIYPQKFESKLASEILYQFLPGTGWEVGMIETDSRRTIDLENHTNPYSFLITLAREFDVELRFRIEHDGNKITGRYVDMLIQRGEWQGREVEFGKDLIGIRRVEKQDIVTALLGLGPEREDGARLEVLVEDKEALQRWGRVDKDGNLHHLIETYEIESSRTEMTENEAKQYTRTALNKRINTQVGYETTIADLENVPGMQNKQVRFGDTIRIKDTTFAPPLYLEARVYEMNRSIKFKEKKDIKLGDYIEYTEEEVTAIFRQLQAQIRNKISQAQLEDHTYDKDTIDNKDNAVLLDAEDFVDKFTYDKNEIDRKDGNVLEETGERVEKAEQNAKDYTDNNALIKDKEYNGLKWSDVKGLIVERDDGKVRSILSGSDGIKVQRKDNGNWVDMFYVDSSGNVTLAGVVDISDGGHSNRNTFTIISRSAFHRRYYESGISSRPFDSVMYDSFFENGIKYDIYGTSNALGLNGDIIANVSIGKEGFEISNRHIEDLGDYDWYHAQYRSSGIKGVGFSETRPFQFDIPLSIFTGDITVDGYIDGYLRKIDWINANLENRWQHASDGFVPQYKKDRTGFVHLRGRVKNGSTNSRIFTLPIDYRPEKTVRFPTFIGSATNFGQITVTPDGQVSVWGAGDTSGGVNLDGMYFEIK